MEAFNKTAAAEEAAGETSQEAEAELLVKIEWLAVAIGVRKGSRVEG